MNLYGADGHLCQTPSPGLVSLGLDPDECGECGEPVAVHAPGGVWVRCEADHEDGGVCLTRHLAQEACPKEAHHA